jgi:vancomycin resistance protein YoaR
MAVDSTASRKPSPGDSPSLPPSVERLERRARLRRRQRTKRVVGAVLVLLVLAWGAYAWSIRGEAAPAVTVSGVDVGGLDAAATEERLAKELAPRLTQPVEVTIGDQKVAVTPTALGIGLDLDGMVAKAMDADRLTSRVLPVVGGGSDVPLALTPPEKPKLTPGVRRVERKPVDAELAVSKQGKVSTTPSQEGVDVQPAKLVAAVMAAVRAGQTSATVEPRILPPKVLTAAAEKGAAEARQLLSAPIVLRSKGKSVGKVEPKELAPAIVIGECEGGACKVRVDADKLAGIVARDARKLEREPVDAGFRVSGRRVRIVAHKNGLALHPIDTARLVRNAGLTTDSRQAELALRSTEPELTTAKAKSWGIKQPIRTVTTDLGASPANRIHNVKLLASILDGKVVPPGKTFSFNEYVGQRTPERGFKEGYAIVGGLFLPSIGGGVCQAATTVYDAAFYAGLRIEERTNHSFYISHYALGMDATVDWAGPDLKFTNDTKYGILIKAWADAATMTVSLYSSPNGRTVEKRVGERHSFSDPTDRYILKRGLPPAAKVKTVEGSRGFRVDVERIVREKGKVLYRSTFTSNYVPEETIWRVGPNAQVPGAIENPPEGLDRGLRT